jgi:cyclin G-associated kinase
MAQSNSSSTNTNSSSSGSPGTKVTAMMKRLSTWAGALVNASGDSFVGRYLNIDGECKVFVEAVLAHGGYGIVYRVSSTKGRKYALKKLLGQDKQAIQTIKNEVKVLRSLNEGEGHPNILRLLLAAQSEVPHMQDAAEFLILTELCPGGNLMEHLQRTSGPLSILDVKNYFMQAVSAVEFMHSRKPALIHRDIKAENYLLASDNWLRLCDFGSTTTETIDTSKMGYKEMQAVEDRLNLVTTPQNRTPEMLDMHVGRPINEKVDIWALGCLLYTLCFKVHPFEDGSKLAIVNLRYTVPESTEYQVFIPLMTKQLLNPDPAKRPAAKDIKV